MVKISICEEKKNFILLFILFVLVLAISLQDSTMMFLIYVWIFFRFNKIMVNCSACTTGFDIVASRRLLSMRKTRGMSHATLALASWVPSNPPNCNCNSILKTEPFTFFYLFFAHSKEMTRVMTVICSRYGMYKLLFFANFFS